MKKSLWLFSRTFIAMLLFLCAEESDAAEVPKSPERLREAASHILVGKITRVESRCQISELEKGGTDYLIQCSIAVESVEKGDRLKAGDELVANCFQPKTRLSLLQSFSLQGHSPVPAAGQQVRAYLIATQGKYHVVHPNGFAPTNGSELVEPLEVAQLGHRNPRFSFLLPLEVWALIAFTALSAAVVVNKFPRLPLQRAFRVVLTGLAALLAVGLIIGVLEFLKCT